MSADGHRQPHPGRRGGLRRPRLHRPGDAGHIAGMGIAYTAMLTAFYVDNGPHLPLWDRLPALAFWLLPSAIAAPLIARAIRRSRRRHRRSPRRRRGRHGPDPAGLIVDQVRPIRDEISARVRALISELGS